MYRGARIAVVVPAYNEAALIERSLADIPEWVDDVYVVDDGSSDETATLARAVLERRGAVLRHEHNRGVGAAIATGYEAAFRAGADIAAVMAGDAQMDGADLHRLLDPLVDGSAAYAKGDRLRFPGSRQLMPFTRYWGNRALSWLTRLATGLSVSDSQCGYTALSRRAAGALELDTLWPRYGYPNDLLGRLARAQVAIAEVPVRPVYAGERSGIGWRHALIVIPMILVWVRWRRWCRSSELAEAARSPD